MTIESLSSINHFELPALAAVGSLAVRSAPLNHFDLGGLTSATTIELSGLSVMKELRLPKLATVGSLSIKYNNQVNAPPRNAHLSPAATPLNGLRSGLLGAHS